MPKWKIGDKLYHTSWGGDRNNPFMYYIVNNNEGGRYTMSLQTKTGLIHDENWSYEEFDVDDPRQDYIWILVGHNNPDTDYDESDYRETDL